MKLTITVPTAKLQATLRAIPQQAKAAAAEAINVSAKQAELDVVGEMRAVFDRPTPWALGGITSDKATASNLSALVRVRGKVGTAVPAEAFLKAEIEGGQRRFKRFEVALFKAGVLPAGYYAVPGSGARIDAYGNVSSGQIVQLLSYFQAFPPGSRRQNTSAARRARLGESTARRQGVAYVAIQPGNRNLYPGIYEYRDLGTLGTGVRAVFIFVKRASYQARLKFFDVAEKTLVEQLPRQWTRLASAALGPGGRL